MAFKLGRIEGRWITDPGWSGNRWSSDANCSSDCIIRSNLLSARWTIMTSIHEPKHKPGRCRNQAFYHIGYIKRPEKMDQSKDKNHISEVCTVDFRIDMLQTVRALYEG